MKRLFLIMFAFATLAILSSCSRKAPDVSLMPDCNQSCQEFTNFVEELTPLKCKGFEGSDQNLCHILVDRGVSPWNGYAISEDDLDNTKRDSLKGRPVYQFSGHVPGRITIYDGLSQEQLKKHCFETLNNDNRLSKLIAEFDDLSDQDIEKIRTFISKYIEITNKADALEIRKLQTENLNKNDRREIFENEFGINYNNIDKEKGKFVDEIREASDDLPDSLPKVRYLDVGSEQHIFIYLEAFYTYITLKSKYSSSSKTLKNKPELLKDIESFSNAYFNRFIRYMHAKDTHIDDNHKKEIREHILSAVMAFVISEDRLPTSNEEIMSTLYQSMPFNDLERIAIDLQNYSMLTNEFSGIKFSKNDFEKSLRCLSPMFSIFFKDIDEDYKNGVPMYKHLISSYSCQYIDIKYKGGMITATSPGWDNKIGSKDDIVIFEYEGDKILSYISEFKAATPSHQDDSSENIAAVKALPSHQDDSSENTAAVKALPSHQDDSSENTAAVKALPSQQDDNSEAKFTEHIQTCLKAMTNGDFNEAQLYCDLARDISPNDPRYLALNEQLRKEIDSQNALSDVLKNLSNGECRNAVNALDNIQKGTFAYTTMLEKDYKTKARECFEKANAHDLEKNLRDTPQAKSIASTIMRYAEHEISLEEGKTVGQFFSIKKGLKPCLKSPKKCSKTIAPLVDESYVKFNRGVIAAILLQNNDTFDKDLFKEVQKTLLIPMNDSSERMRIANKSPVGREIMGANTLSNEDKINIFAIWYLRQFPYAGENIWNNTPSTRRSWKDYLEMADLYLDAI